MFSVVNHFSVVKYNDVEKKPTFEVITSTDDVEYAKKVAFQCAKKNMIQEKNADKTGGDWVYKISTNTKNEHVNPVNKTVQSYRVMKRASGENFQATCAFSNVFAVIEMEKYIVEEIDTSLLCDIQYPFRKKIEILFEF